MVTMGECEMKQGRKKLESYGVRLQNHEMGFGKLWAGRILCVPLNSGLIGEVLPWVDLLKIRNMPVDCLAVSCDRMRFHDISQAQGCELQLDGFM